MKIAAPVKYFIAAIALGWLFFTGNISLERVAAVRLNSPFSCLIAVLFSCLACQAARWWCLLRFHGISIAIAKTFKFFWIGSFFYVVLPGAVGGELARTYYLVRNDPSSRFRGILSVITDRLMGIYVFFLLAALASLFLPPEANSNAFLRYHCLFATTIVFGLPLLLSLSFSKRLRSFVGSKLPGMKPGSTNDLLLIYKRHIGWLPIAFCLSIAVSFLFVAGFWCAGLCIGFPVDFRIALLDVPLIVVANSLPISPGGIGVGESAAFVIFKQSGYLAGAELMILVRAVITFLRLPGIVFFLRHKQ